MSVHVTLGLGPGGPVAIKTATHPDEIDRLQREAARLRRASHPGVVAVVSCGPVGRAVELRTRYAGDALGRWAGSLDRAAGLAAAVATTLADLHDIGLVHGRLDASHVLVGSDGRPRLCGFSGPGDARPADDVHALASLLDELLSRVAVDRRSPLALARSRGPAGDRRALSQVVSRAVDPVASRRPSARALAASILGAVPGADLPPPSALPSVSGSADGFRRWLAGATGTPPLPEPRQPPAPSRTPVPAPVPEPEPAVGVQSDDHDVLELPFAAPGAPGTGGPDDLGGLDHRADPGADRWPDPGNPASAGQPARRPAGDVAARGRGDPPQPGPARTPAWPDLDRLDALTWARAGDDGADGADPQAPPGSDRTAPRPSPLPRLGDARLTTGPPARPEGLQRPIGLRGRRRTALRVGSACGVGLALVAGGAAATWGGATGGDSGVDPGAPSPAAASTPAGCAEAPPPVADVDGDGCPSAVGVDGNVVHAEGVRWSLGEPGDLVTVGDWDCDGGASPALVRPTTGDVFVFPHWAPEGEPVTAEPVATVAPGSAEARPRPRADGCDELVVELPTGETVVDVEARP